MRYPRRLCLGLLSAAVWPGYVILLAYAAYVAPWPRNVGWLASMSLLSVAFALFAVVLGRMATAEGGWIEIAFKAPVKVTRQIRRVTTTLPIAAVVLLLPTFLAHMGWVASGDRPVSAVAMGRLFVLAFELTVWGSVYRLLRRSSPLLEWLTADAAAAGWLGRHRVMLSRIVLAALGAMIALDVAGYRYSAQRLAYGWGGSTVLALGCWGLYQVLVRLIDSHAWRWTKATPPSSLSVPTTPAAVIGNSLAPVAGSVGTEGAVEVDDPVARFRNLARFAVAFLGLFLASLIWNVDMALFRYLGEQQLWQAAAGSGSSPARWVTLGDFTRMVLILFATGFAWRHLNACFTLVVFPRLPDDPGIRYAVVTLCRYLVLGVGVLSGLSSIQLGLERIGVVVAALGVGLGFGLQEIVSNFVSGIILLLERPIRVGDVVTVNGMSGKVDRINIRATMIINGENQSLIIPNRQFITGNLINWTHKDKVVRVEVAVNVAHGSDPDKVTDLLLTLAHEDADILKNPVPSALLDGFGESTMNFKLWAHVPEPSLMGRVKHRLLSQIQCRFKAANIEIPFPTRELRVHATDLGDIPQTGRPHIRPPDVRFSPASPSASASTVSAVRVPLPVPDESRYRCVDE